MRKQDAAIHRLAALLRNFFVFTLILAGLSLHAQVAGTGTIQGAIADSTGAILPGATVTITNVSTQVKRSAVTDSSGIYVFPNIEIGTYTVNIAAPGFATYNKTNNVLEVGSNITINVALTVGRQDQTIEVKADSLALQTEDVSFKQTIDQQDVTEIPLNSNGRQITGLISISGGSTPAPTGDFTGSKFSYQTISVSIAGGNGNTTMWRLDGGDNNDYMGNGNAPFPFPDAIAQFSVESTALGAQDGMHSGGLVNVVTRSGTNLYHGTAFEFIRNNYLDATNFGVIPPNGPGSGKDTLHQNEYGGTFGGPVRIPHLYNGRDKLFFFAGYQFLENKSGTGATTAHVPTAANLAGDFSVTDPSATANGVAVGTKDTTAGACNTTYTQLYDPITGGLLVGNKYGAGSVPVSQFTSELNPAAQKLLAYLPKINPAVDTGNCGVVQYVIPSQIFDKQFVTRVDYTINAKHHLYGRYLLDGYQAPSFFSPTNVLLATPAPGNYERVQSGTIGEDFTINSRLVNSAHVTVLRRVDLRQSAPGINACTLGITLYCAVATGFQTTVSGKFSTYCGTCAPGHYNDNSLSFADDVTMLRGKHQIVFGGEFVRNQLNIVGAYESNGTWTVGGNINYSGNGPAGGGLAGDADLDFLVGATASFQQSKQQQNALRGNIPSLYLQDTYHPTKRLTMVAGIRWAPEYLPSDFYNRGSVFSMAGLVAGTLSSVYPTAPFGSSFYGDPGVSRQFTKNSPWQFSPNVGASFDPLGNGKTVIRAGAELIYDEVNFFTAQRVNQNPPFATASSPATSAQLCYSNPWLVGGTGAGCFQTGGTNVSPYPQPAVPTPSQAVFPAQGQFIVLPPHFHPSYTVQYTMSVQHDFGKGWELQFDYIGNGTRHAPIGYPLNPAVFVPGVWGAGGTGCTGVVLTGPAAAKPGAAGTNCSTTANQNSRFLLTQLSPGTSSGPQHGGNQYTGGGSGSILVGDFATANYNGLVTSLNHRLSTTLSVLANWTWSKCLNEADGNGDVTGTAVENPNQARLDYGPCGSDYRNIENLVIVSKSEFHIANRLVKQLVNNWELAPRLGLLSGSPQNVTSGQDNSLTDVGNDRPSLVPGVPIYLKTKYYQAAGQSNRGHINPAAFQQVTTAAGCVSPFTACPALGTYGNVSRNAFRSPPALNLDAQLSRIFPIHERLAATFRLEGFNVLNHPNFGGGGGSITSATFGQVSFPTNARVFQGSVKLSF